MAARYNSVEFSDGDLSDFSDAGETGTLAYSGVDAITVSTGAQTANLFLPAVHKHAPAALAAFDEFDAHREWTLAKAEFDADPANNEDPGAEPTNPMGGQRAWDLGDNPGAGNEDQIVIVEDDARPFVVDGVSMTRDLFAGFIEGLDLILAIA